MKLKTLKDIGKEYASSTERGIILNRVDINELRQEAIKWVKETRGNPTQEITDVLGINIDFHEQEFEIIEKWIKYFFNLTVGDLE